MTRTDYLRRFPPNSAEARAHGLWSGPVFARPDPPSEAIGLALIEFLERHDVVFECGYSLKADLVCDSPYEFADLVSGRYDAISGDDAWWVARWRVIRAEIPDAAITAWRDAFLAHPSVVSVD